MLEKDYDRSNNIVFDPFDQNSDMSDLGFMIENIAKCSDYYLEDKFKSEISNLLSDNSYFQLLHLNTRSPTNKLDDLQQYLMETAHKW